MHVLLLSLVLSAPPEVETKLRVEKLVQELKNGKKAEQVTAVMGLADLGPAAKDAVSALRAATASKEIDLRTAAAAALVLIDQAESAKAFPIILDSFKSFAEIGAQFSVLTLLGGKLKPTTKETAQGLLQLAATDSPFGVIVADMALSRVEKGNKAVLPALDAGLKAENDRSRLLAARFLARVDATRTKDAVEVLLAALKIKSLETKLMAAQHLMELDDNKTETIVEALTPSLKDKDERSACRVAVFLIDVDAAQAEKGLPVLKKGLDTPVAEPKREILQSLGRMMRTKPERLKLVLPLFEQALKDEMLDTRATAINELATLGPAALPAEKLLRDAGKDRRPEIALAAVEAQMRVRPEKAAGMLTTLIEWAEKRDKTARGTRDVLELVEKLKLLQPPGSDEDWAATMADQIEQRSKRLAGAWHREELVRLHAVIELGELKRKGKKGVPVLVKLLKDRDSAGDIVRGQAALALGRIGREANDAIPMLLRVSKDENEMRDVRWCAREALKMIDRDKDN